MTPNCIRVFECWFWFVFLLQTFVSHLCVHCNIICNSKCDEIDMLICFKKKKRKEERSRDADCDKSYWVSLFFDSINESLRIHLKHIWEKEKVFRQKNEERMHNSDGFLFSVENWRTQVPILLLLRKQWKKTKYVLLQWVLLWSCRVEKTK